MQWNQSNQATISVSNNADRISRLTVKAVIALGWHGIDLDAGLSAQHFSRWGDGDFLLRMKKTYFEMWLTWANVIDYAWGGARFRWAEEEGRLVSIHFS